MTNTRRISLILRWSVLTTIIVGLFWIVMWIVTGEMPTVDKIQLTTESVVMLPFAIPRLCDALFVGIVVAAHIAMFTSKIVNKQNDSGVVVGLKAGLSTGLGVGLIAGMTLGLFFGLVAGILVGLFYGLIFLIKKIFSHSL